jgi:hypothetical protein
VENAAAVRDDTAEELTVTLEETIDPELEVREMP